MTEHSPALETSRRQLPRHVAVIMDGNGRWATERGLPRTAGHEVFGSNSMSSPFRTRSLMLGRRMRSGALSPESRRGLFSIRLTNWSSLMSKVTLAGPK